MKLLDWIFARAARPDTDFRILEGNATKDVIVELEDTDDDELSEDWDDDWVDDDDHSGTEAAPDNKKQSKGEPLENLFCYIEYRDSAGSLTRRPVTMISLLRSSTNVSIFAVCHMRKATRTFRCDRIINVITVDGEIIPGQDYLREVLAIEITPEAVDIRTNIPRLRTAILAPLTVLVAAAKSDGEYHIEEIDRIVAFAEREAHRLSADGLISDDMTIEASDALTKAIRGMRPQARTLERHIMAVLSQPEDQRRRFKRALEAVMIADGHIRQEEQEFWQDFDRLAVSAGLDPLSTWDEIRKSSRRVA